MPGKREPIWHHRRMSICMPFEQQRVKKKVSIQYCLPGTITTKKEMLSYIKTQEMKMLKWLFVSVGQCGCIYEVEYIWKNNALCCFSEINELYLSISFSPLSAPVSTSRSRFLAPFSLSLTHIHTHARTEKSQSTTICLFYQHPSLHQHNIRLHFSWQNHKGSMHFCYFSSF